MGSLWQTPVLKEAARNLKAVQEFHNRGRKGKFSWRNREEKM